jgi:hypothetical protein
LANFWKSDPEHFNLVNSQLLCQLGLFDMLNYMGIITKWKSGDLAFVMFVQAYVIKVSKQSTDCSEKFIDTVLSSY